MASILNSITKAVVPVRREGWPFIGVLLLGAAVLGWAWQPLFWIGVVLAAWCAYFFRDPPRVTPIHESLIVSPADGRVVSVSGAPPPAELGLGGQSRRRISIFMNIFDCHVNRAPIGGTVERVVYKPGRFLNAELDKASQDNERNAIILETGHGSVAVVQIAGMIARRIVCFVNEGDRLAAGERIGLIRFGSRVDVYLPPDAAVLIAEGQTTIAGETVIASFDAAAMDRSVRID